MAESNIWKQALLRLRAAGDGNAQIAEIQHCGKFHLVSPSMVKSYYDTLLFIITNAFDEKSHNLAETELTRLISIINRHKTNKKWQHLLCNSGLPYTEMRCQFSTSLIKWLLETFPKKVEPLDAGLNIDIFQQLSQSALPGIEFHHTTQGRYNIWNRIKWLSGHYRNEAALEWLITLIDQQEWPPVLKDQLYDKLKIFVKWTLGPDEVGMSFNRLPVQSVYFQRTVKFKTTSLTILKTLVKEPLPLSLKEKEKLISVIRSSLAFHARETDPVTFSDPGETFLYEMGEGIQIALTGMIKERRLALESYIGYMVFKNGLPVSYGGGWIWGHRCKIGINIYPPFRGGDSNKLFCQIMRLYFQVYHVRRFVVKPYQFGKGNPEGLKSGAFWFYYKLGFRPVNAEIRKIADLEWEKIKSGDKYRTPLSLLKKFTACNKEWEPEITNYSFIDADKISIAITEMIKRRYKGDRKIAIEKSMLELKRFLGFKRLPNFTAVEKKVWHNWCLLFVCLQGTDSWTGTDRKKFQQLLESKSSGHERDFIHQLQEHKRLQVSIEAMLNDDNTRVSKK